MPYVDGSLTSVVSLLPKKYWRNECKPAVLTCRRGRTRGSRNPCTNEIAVQVKTDWMCDNIAVSLGSCYFLVLRAFRNLMPYVDGSLTSVLSSTAKRVLAQRVQAGRADL